MHDTVATGSLYVRVIALTFELKSKPFSPVPDYQMIFVITFMRGIGIDRQFYGRIAMNN